MTAWRLRKHKRLHTQMFTKTCKYFEGNKACPFEVLGCKFKHEHRKDTFDESDDKNSNTDDITSKASSSYERDREMSSFCTSTAKSINCQECMNWSECFVRQTLGRHGGGRKLHFGKWTGHPL